MDIKVSKILFLISLMTISNAERCILPGRYKDYSDLSGRLYYVCNYFGGIPIYFRCPINDVFNDLTHVCEATIIPVQAECSLIQIIMGRMPNPNGDGTTYIDCTQPSLGPRIIACPSGLFSPILLCCYDATTTLVIINEKYHKLIQGGSKMYPELSGNIGT